MGIIGLFQNESKELPHSEESSSQLIHCGSMKSCTHIISKISTHLPSHTWCDGSR